MTATQRVLEDFDKFSKMFCDGISYRKIAKEFDTHSSTIVQHVMPKLHSMGKITKEMEGLRNENKPTSTKGVFLNNRVERRNKVYDVQRKIRTSQLYPEIKVAYILSSTNPNSEWRILKGLLNLVDKEFFKDKSHLTIMHFMRDMDIPGVDIGFYRLLIDLLNIDKVRQFEYVFGDYKLTFQQDATITDMLYALPKKQQEILRMYYYDGLTLREVSERIGGCIERMRYLRAKAFSKLKECEYLKQCFDKARSFQYEE